MSKWKLIDRELILASGSPRRKELLTRMGLPFRIEVDSVEDENQYFLNVPFLEGLAELARAKASGVAGKNPDALVIGSDTIVVHNDLVLGKPRDRKDAFEMLKNYSGTSHFVYTCVSLESVNGRFYASVTAKTEVTFRRIEEWEINEYLDRADYKDKAGAYGIQDDAMLFVDSVNGCYTNVVGFPVTSVISLFQQYQEKNPGAMYE